MIKVSTTKIEPMKEKDCLPLQLAKAKFINDFRSSLESLQEKVISENTLKEIKSKFYSKLNEYRMQVHKENSPFYKHDCSECVWFGDFIEASFDKGILNFSFYDLYYHDRETTIEFVARYGDCPSDYISYTHFKNLPTEEIFNKMLEIKKTLPPIFEIYNRISSCMPTLDLKIEIK